MYWDDASLRFTVIDGGVEHDLYTQPFTIDGESDEFQSPFYLIANLAIGGVFTDAYQPRRPQTAASRSPCRCRPSCTSTTSGSTSGTARATSQLGPPAAQAGAFGIFTDETPTNGGLEAEVTSQIYVWENTLTAGSIPPVRGRQRPDLADDGRGLVRRGHHVHPAAEPVRLRRRPPEVHDPDPGERDLQDRDHRRLGQSVLRRVPGAPDDLRPGAQRQLGPGGHPRQRHPRHRDRPAHAELRVRHPRGARRVLRVRPGRHLLGRRRHDRRRRRRPPRRRPAAPAARTPRIPSTPARTSASTCRRPERTTSRSST